MWFLVSILINLALAWYASSKATIPKTDIRPAGIDDFKFPTVSEARTVPIFFGTVWARGPNIITYFDYRVQPIIKTQKIKGLFGSKKVKQTIGYKYFISLDCGIGFGKLALKEIRFGDYQVYINASNTPTNLPSLEYDEPGLFGDPEGEGGCAFKARFYAGLGEATDDTLVNAQVRQQPGCPNLSHIVFEDMYIGNSTNVRPLSFVVARFPDPLNQGDGIARINDTDANPALIAYEVFTNTQWGAEEISSHMDQAAFQAAAVTLKDEGLGMSYQIDGNSDVSDIKNEIERHINGAIFRDPLTGKLTIKLIRDDYNIETIAALNDDDVDEVADFSRGAITKIVSEVRVTYVDINENFKERTAIATDTAAKFLVGKSKAVSLDYRALSNPTIAAKVAYRDLLPLTISPASFRLICNRRAAALMPGDVFKLAWTPLGITQIIGRIKSVDYGTLVKGVITLDVMEDVFSMKDAVYGSNPDTGAQDMFIPPIDITGYFSIELPYYLQEKMEFGSSGFAIFAQAPTGSYEGFFLNAGIINNGPYVEYTELSPFADAKVQMRVDLTQIDATGNIQTYKPPTSVLAHLVSATDSQILQEGYNLALIYSSSDNYEIIGYQNITGSGTDYTLTGVKRGLMDTTPLDFTAASTHIYFLDVMASNFTSYSNAAVVYYKMRGKNNAGTLALTSATQRNIVFDKRHDRPLVPTNIKINSNYFPTSIPASTDVVVTWSRRQRSGELLQHFYGTADNSETNVSYKIRYYTQANVLIGSERTINGTTDTLVFGDIPGGTTSIRVEVEGYNTSSTLISLFTFKHTFNIS